MTTIQHRTHSFFLLVTSSLVFGLGCRWVPVLPFAHDLEKDVPTPVRVEMMGGPVATPDGLLVYSELGKDPGSDMLSPHAAMVRLHLTLTSSEIEDTFEEPVEVVVDPIDAELDMLENEAPLTSTQILKEIFNETANTTAPLPEVEAEAGLTTEPQGRVEYEASQSIGDLVGVPRSIQAMLYNARFANVIAIDELNPLAQDDTVPRAVIQAPAGHLNLNLEMEDFRQGHKVSPADTACILQPCQGTV